ncbi:MAG: menaquinone biosynthesis protein [Nitrospirae bacterium]|uniref:menaquinone biosynthetic enzyme MqnA/MqnD family protein n=1 Tax=Candidatus Magnetobacterium casense TaxID=1455061 RepID=UPI000590FCE8|nr:menaquinone biosynthesis protein [Candidatus Magnetobacterium casensis]MBF0336676.1 menaquinone biosynthesis protein [Nitrospirota bacterium]
MRIGRIDFANLYPIFHCLERLGDRARLRYEFTGGVPSQVNALMRQGLIDVGPASSIEYLRNRHLYDLIPGHCISACGQVMSIILFSTVEIERLDGATVLTTTQAETSTVLLRIILREFYGLDCNLRGSTVPLMAGLSQHPAYLLIGDDALIEAQRRSEQLYAYDLSSIWYEKTGESFVFALWFAQKGFNAELLNSLRCDLDQARAEAMSNLPDIAIQSPYAGIIALDILLRYWQTIGYEMAEPQMRGLRLFEKYAEQLGLL